MTCHLWSLNGAICYLHDAHDYGNYVNILSAALTGIAALLEFILIFLVKDLDIYSDSTEDNGRAVEMQTFTRSDTAPSRPGTGSEPHSSDFDRLIKIPKKCLIFIISSSRSSRTGNYPAAYTSYR